MRIATFLAILALFITGMDARCQGAFHYVRAHSVQAPVELGTDPGEEKKELPDNKSGYNTRNSRLVRGLSSFRPQQVDRILSVAPFFFGNFRNHGQVVSETGVTVLSCDTLFAAASPRSPPPFMM